MNITENDIGREVKREDGVVCKIIRLGKKFGGRAYVRYRVHDEYYRTNVYRLNGLPATRGLKKLIGFVSDNDAPVTPVAFPQMTLRDWFAGQALVGFCANSGGDIDMRKDNFADLSYKYADAMMAEREKEK